MPRHKAVRPSLSVVLSLAVVALSSTSSPAAYSGDGKEASFVSSSGLAISSGGAPTNMLLAIITKGKPRHVLAAEAMVTNLGGFTTPRRYTCLVQVNNVQLGPGSMSLYNLANTGAESLSGTFWIDLDTFPGLVGVPLAVILECTEGTGFGDTSLSATLNVRLVKKK